MPNNRADAASRPLRSDAATNKERLLVAAAATISRRGSKVPMANIAAAAGVGIGTLYRHYPTRAALLAALSERSYQLVLEHARTAATSSSSATEAIRHFLNQTIAARDDLILPLHSGPVSLDPRIVALRTEISDLLEQVLQRGREDGTIRPDLSAVDLIIAGAMLAQPLANTTDWDHLARRQATIFIAGISATPPEPLPGSPPQRQDLEAAFRQANQT